MQHLYHTAGSMDMRCKCFDYCKGVGTPHRGHCNTGSLPQYTLHDCSSVRTYTFTASEISIVGLTYQQGRSLPRHPLRARELGFKPHHVGPESTHIDWLPNLRQVWPEPHCELSAQGVGSHSHPSAQLELVALGMKSAAVPLSPLRGKPSPTRTERLEFCIEGNS
jgi:hypothetical protein